MEYNPFNLCGKTILVTGASSGIGRASAIECSKLGADCIIVGRNKERLSETLSQMEGNNHQCIIAELTSNEDVKSIVAAVDRLNGVVLCAGKAKTLPLQFSSKEDFEDMFSVNFYAPVELLRTLYKTKKLLKDSSVVIVSSIGGLYSFAGSNAVYGTSKAALNSAMKYAAIEFAPRKVRVNSICPGMVDTPLIHRGTISEEQLVEDAKRYPLKRYGQPEDIAHGITYLLSDASSWVTGHSLVIDGGISI